MIGRLLFFYFAAMILGSAVAVISLRSLLHSALALLVTLVHVAGIYVLLNVTLSAISRTASRLNADSSACIILPFRAPA